MVVILRNIKTGTEKYLKNYHQASVFLFCSPATVGRHRQSGVPIKAPTGAEWVVDLRPGHHIPKSRRRLAVRVVLRCDDIGEIKTYDSMSAISRGHFGTVALGQRVRDRDGKNWLVTELDKRGTSG